MLNLSGWNLNTPKLQIGKTRSRVAVKTMRYFAVAFVMLLGSETQELRVDEICDKLDGGCLGITDVAYGPKMALPKI
jgi:hypothetical protein